MTVKLNIMHLLAQFDSTISGTVHKNATFRLSFTVSIMISDPLNPRGATGFYFLITVTPLDQM